MKVQTQSFQLIYVQNTSCSLRWRHMGVMTSQITTYEMFGQQLVQTNSKTGELHITIDRCPFVMGMHLWLVVSLIKSQ